jgi:hypothetical protein
MKASGNVGSNGVYVSDNLEKRFETDIYSLHIRLKAKIMYKVKGFAKARWMSVI